MKLTIALYFVAVGVLRKKHRMRQLFHAVEVIQIVIQSTEINGHYYLMKKKRNQGKIAACEFQSNHSTAHRIASHHINVCSISKIVVVLDTCKFVTFVRT